MEQKTFIDYSLSLSLSSFLLFHWLKARTSFQPFSFSLERKLYIYFSRKQEFERKATVESRRKLFKENPEQVRDNNDIDRTVDSRALFERD